MPIGPARMPLLDHLGELRRRMTIIVVSVLLTTVVVYIATPTLIELMMDAIRQALPEGTPLTVLSALGGFTIRFKVALFFGVIVCTPIIVWEIFGFVLPALKEKERRWVVPTFIVMVLLFFIGMAFCYAVILEAAFGWLVDQSVEMHAQVLADATDYLDLMMMLEVAFGVTFQLPLFVFYLSILRVVPYKTFRENWRIVYMGLMVLSALFTPDASPMTMILMYFPMVLLYEAALAVARQVITARDGKAALKWSREDYEEHQDELEARKLARLEAEQQKALEKKKKSRKA